MTICEALDETIRQMSADLHTDLRRSMLSPRKPMVKIDADELKCLRAKVAQLQGILRSRKT